MPSLKSLAKDTAIYGLSSIMARFINYLLVPIQTAKFNAAGGQYGVITNVYAYVALLIILLTYGMETTFFRFMSREGEDPRKVYATTLKMVGTTSILFAVLVCLFIHPLASALGYADHPEYILVMYVTVAIDAFTAIPFAYLRYAHRPIKFATLKVLNITLNILLNSTTPSSRSTWCGCSTSTFSAPWPRYSCLARSSRASARLSTGPRASACCPTHGRYW